jgi:3-hydroxyacyl-[acyl-carrier-protein] dehydratase
MQLERFQLIDRIVAIDLASGVIHTEATVPTESLIFEGHFPGYPLMPGVLLVETMAQTSGWLLIAIRKFSHMPFLASVKSAKFRTAVRPGQHLAVTGNIVHEGSGYAVTTAEIRCDGKPVCSSELAFRLMDFPNPQFRASMEKVAQAITFPMEALAHG